MYFQYTGCTIPTDFPGLSHLPQHTAASLFALYVLPASLGKEALSLKPGSSSVPGECKATEYSAEDNSNKASPSAPSQGALSRRSAGTLCQPALNVQMISKHPLHRHQAGSILSPPSLLCSLIFFAVIIPGRPWLLISGLVKCSEFTTANLISFSVLGNYSPLIFTTRRKCFHILFTKS